jgi:aspartate dehydrogenase
VRAIEQESREQRFEKREIVRLGLIGCGSIGSTVAAAIARGAAPEMQLIGLVDPMNHQAAMRVAAGAKCAVCPDIASLLELRPSVVLEAASADAVRTYAGLVFDSGADLVMVSVGALADADFLERLTEHARSSGRRLLVPSGAIGGVDIIKAAAIGGLDECRLTTRKHPAALNTAYVRELGVDLAGMREATTIFEGAALEAVRHFPQNLNVAVTISLAGLGLDRTTVRVIADPEATHNIHEVFLRGTFGEATIRLVNRPSLENPRSSSLVCYSVIAALQGIGREFQLGA